MLFIFDGGTLSPARIAELQPDPSEIEAIGLHNPGEIFKLAPERLARRIDLAVHAGQFRYAERGLTLNCAAAAE